MPLALTDAELAVVMAATRPIPPHQRSAFLADVAAELAKYPEVGPGLVGRIVAKLQREHLNGPNLRGTATRWER